MTETLEIRVTRIKDILNALPPLAQTVLLLDFDGTLVEIADRPGNINVPPSLAKRLQSLQRETGGGLAIVTGRDLETLDGFLPNFEGSVFASHGAEMRLDGDVKSLQVSAQLKDAVETLTAWAEGYSGIEVEAKSSAVVVHFRRAPDREKEVREITSAVVQTLDDFSASDAKMAVELKSREATKARAVDTLCGQYPRRFPVAIGDDTTDESMFQAASDRGGFGIKVGPETTLAKHRISTPEDVVELLDFWLERDAR